MVEPILESAISSSTLLSFDLLLRTIGAPTIIAILFYVVKLARTMGSFETKVSDGFKNNAEEIAKVSVRVDRQGDRMNTLVGEVGELRGEIRRMGGGWRA